MSQVTHCTRSQTELPPTFESIDSNRYNRNGAVVDCEHFYYECGQAGASIAKLRRYDASQWELETNLKIGSGNSAEPRQKMMALIDLIGCEKFMMQKNVLRRINDSPVPITQGKMAQCAAEVVVRWLDERGTPNGLRLNDLCLDSILQVDCTLQIYLAHRAPIEGPTTFGCIAKSPREQVAAGPSCRDTVEAGPIEVAPTLFTRDQCSYSAYPYLQSHPFPPPPYGNTSTNYELYQPIPAPVGPWPRTAVPRSHASQPLLNTRDTSDARSGPERHSRRRTQPADPYPGEYQRRIRRRVLQGHEGRF